jgi:peptidoglycan/xylan/chitin deacetylase (PgdA/CDA1 family)
MSTALRPLSLAYHGVSEVPMRHDPDGLFVRPSDLARQVERLRSWGYRMVSFGDLARRAERGEAAGYAALTFDDGFVDNLDHLSPLLAQLGAPATVFVVSGWLGKPLPSAPWTRVLTAEELVELSDSRVEIGAHTVTHPDLTTIPFDQARAEMERSREELEELLAKPVDVFAYPWGRASTQTREACRLAGYRAACRINGEGSWSEPLNLPRQNMNNGSTILGLRLKSADIYEPLMRWPPARAARKLVRSVRRQFR